MPRPSLQLGIVTLFVLAIAGLNLQGAGPPVKSPDLTEPANPKPSEPQPPETVRASAVKLSDANAPIEADIRKALGTVVEVNFVNTPLNDLIDSLAKQTKTNFWVDVPALTEEGVALDEPITLKGKPIAAARILDRVLEPLGLTWIIQDDVVQVTTILAAEDKLKTVTYPVGDLLEYAIKQNAEEVAERWKESLNSQCGHSGLPLPPGASGCLESNDGFSYWLIDVLQSMTSGPWRDIDGTGGSISFLNNNLVIHQTHKNQEEIDQIIRSIRQFVQGPLKPGTISIRPPHYAVKEDDLVKAALTKVISMKCQELPLNAFLADIAATLDIPVMMDEPNLIQEGIAVDEPLSLDLENLPARSVLKLALEPFRLTGIVEDGQIRVTNNDSAEERLFTKIHDIRDLHNARYSGTALLDLLQQETSGPWQDVDGTGGLVDEPLPGLVVIRQMENVHHEVEAILADLRKQMAETPVKPEKPEPVDPQAFSTKFYTLDANTESEAVQRAILALVEPKSWAKNGGEGEIVGIGHQLVVKTKNETHAQVEEFLTKLRKSIDANLFGSGTSFPGGSGKFHQETKPKSTGYLGPGFAKFPSDAIPSQSTTPAP